MAAPDTEAPAPPTRKIPVQQYRPKAQEFLTNIDSVPIQAISLRKSEPTICCKMRSYLDAQLKQAYETIVADVKRISSSLAASKSANIDAAIVAAEKAIQAVYTKMADIEKTTLASINTNCASLDTTATLNGILQKLEGWRQIQLSTSVAMAKIPEKFEADMQANYAKIEKIIGTDF